jgi:predicted amidohydrolase
VLLFGASGDHDEALAELDRIMIEHEDTQVMTPLNKSMEEVDEFLVVERVFSYDESLPSVGIANIHAVVPDIEGNKDKILRAARLFKKRRVNIAVFPEFAISGYFWDDEAACREYMDQAVIENQKGWIEGCLLPLINGDFRAIVLNGLSRGPDGQYFNKTMLIAEGVDYMSSAGSYHKVFLPGIEQKYTVSGKDNRLVIGGHWARVGFTTCYDYLFHELLRLYAFKDKVDAIIETACWRGAATRDYNLMNVRTDVYYGNLWDIVMAASSATNQLWTIACNAVGKHEITGSTFWGGSGVWAPSGLNLLQASHYNEELLVVHNLDITGQRKLETDDFDYAFDFSTVYRAIKGKTSGPVID